MNAAGIDPGLSGGIASIDEQGVLFVDDMPTHMIKTGRKVKNELDVATLRQILGTQSIDHISIEKVAARPGQGVSSMFKFGFAPGPYTG